MNTWRLQPMDTWYFRESRGHDSVGVSELASIFPAPARTLAGAIRTLAGETRRVNWIDWKDSAGECDAELKRTIGFGDALGTLALRGVFPVYAGERLYPWPLNLLEGTAVDGLKEYARLGLGSPLHTHLGQVHAPALKQGRQGFKTPDNAWLTVSGLNRVLAGGVPQADEIVHGGHAPKPNLLKHNRQDSNHGKKRLYVEEARLGIARDRGKRTVREGMLYQARHLRPDPELALDVDIDGLDALELPTQGLLRLGGEGRAASYRIDRTATAQPDAPRSAADDPGLLLILLTPAALDDDWLPPGFSPATGNDGLTTWIGDIAGVSLRIHGAAIGKPLREGGWDMARNIPRPVTSLLPAGSLWYCTVEDGDLQAAAETLHGTHIGTDTALARGLLAAARWPATEITK